MGRAGHDLNYLGWAGVLADTAPALPPSSRPTSPPARSAPSTQVLAALLERDRTGRGPGSQSR